MRLSKTSIKKLKHYIEPLSALDLCIVIQCGIHHIYLTDDVESVPYNKADFIHVRLDNPKEDVIYQTFNNVNQFLQHFCYLRNTLLL